MYPWRIRFSLPVFLRLGCLFPVLFSCGFMDLRPVGFYTVPGIPGTVLPDYFSPVILRFDTAMEKPEVERALQISSDRGRIEGDLSWAGNDLSFVPRGGWAAGTRYTLGLSGTVYSFDRRELRLAEYVPFFAVSCAPAPWVESFSPADGASVRARSEGGRILELRFSCPMDPRSTELAFTLEGVNDRRFDWSEDGRVLWVSSSEPLAPWTAYRWTVNGGAQSRGEVPLARVVSGQFITDEDRLVPEVLRVFPVKYSSGAWIRRGDNLETGPGAGEGIGVEFNKAMDGDSVLRCLRFEPSISGRIEQVSRCFIVFVPERDPEPEKVYTLRVAGDTRDSGGLRMGPDYTVLFTPDIPVLEIVSLSFDKGPAIEGNIPDRASYQVPIDFPGGGVLRFTLRFSLSFTGEASLETALRIALDPFFPGVLPPVSLRYASWLSGDTLRMEWEGLEPGKAGEAHYYRLAIPGGRGGIGTGTGSFLGENKILFLEAAE